MMESEKDPKEIALLLLKATTLPDEQVFRELDAPKYTSVRLRPHGLPHSVQVPEVRDMLHHRRPHPAAA